MPGKDLWVLWRTNFEIDQHYIPIKVIRFVFLVAAHSFVLPPGRPVTVPSLQLGTAVACSCFLCSPHDTARRLLLFQAIGKGAYGVVCSAKNTVTGEKVAIKKIGNAFENLTDARRTLREIKLLRHLRHENIIGVRDIMKASRDRFNDVYLVYELMDTDLHQIIRSSQPLTNEHFQYFIYQVISKADRLDARQQQMARHVLLCRLYCLQ